MKRLLLGVILLAGSAFIQHPQRVGDWVTPPGGCPPEPPPPPSNPTLTPPSHTFTSSQTGLKEVGSTIDTITFNLSFSRGSISPTFGCGGPSFRSGPLNAWQFDHIGVIAAKELSTASTATPLTLTVTDYKVVLDNQTWRARAAYDTGEQPLNSACGNFNSPLAAGNTAYQNRTIEGVLPFFANTEEVGTLTKQALQSHGTVITVTVVTEPTEGGKHTIEFPAAWSVSTPAVTVWSDLHNAFVPISTSVFVIEDAADRTFGGDDYAYKRFLHTGPRSGSRQYRLTF